MNKQAMFDALCALSSELDRASKETVLACAAPKLDAAFFDTLATRCAAAPLRELMGACACKAIALEPRLQVPVHAALLQRVADARNNRDDRDVRIAALHMCGMLAVHAGKQLASSLADTVDACMRQLKCV